MAQRARKSLRRSSAFWDSSAVVPLCVRQASKPRVLALCQSHDMVVWWSTPVEIANALARLVRMNQLSRDDYSTARGLAARLSDSWSVIQPSNAVRASATSLLDRFDLSAADSLQLAAALEWCENGTAGRTLWTADQRLQQAALQLGFDTPPL